MGSKKPRPAGSEQPAGLESVTRVVYAFFTRSSLSRVVSTLTS